MRSSRNSLLVILTACVVFGCATVDPASRAEIEATGVMGYGSSNGSRASGTAR